LRASSDPTKTRKRSKSFAKVSIGRLHQVLWPDTRIICPGDRWNQSGSAKQGFLCVFAPWRETKEAAMTENAIAKEIVDAAFRIHTMLGPGLLESVYDAVLAYELGRRGLRTVRQQPIPVVYENVRIDTGFRADLIVEDK
jgi:hypothetical protein